MITRTPAAPPPGRWIDGLTSDVPLLDALQLIFRQRWLGVLFYLPLAAEVAEEDVEYIHKLRVASRRLSAVLDVLADGFPEAPRQSLYRLVERVRRSCGKARDLDVSRQFLEALLPRASIDDAGGIELLCQKAVEKRAKVQKRLRRRLPRLERRLVQAGDELLAAISALKQTGQTGYASFGQTATRTLQKELTALWRRAADQLDTPQTLHKLRIACKHLRYALEVFMPMLPDSFREEFYPQLEHIQDLLGENHDAVEAIVAVERRRRKWKRRWKNGRPNRGRLAGWHWRELRAGLDAVILAYTQQAEQTREEFLDLWPGFAGDSFRFPVEDLLASLAAASRDNAGPDLDTAVPAPPAAAAEPSVAGPAASGVSP